MKTKTSTKLYQAMRIPCYATAFLVLGTSIGCQTGRQSVSIVPNRVVATNHQNEQSTESEASTEGQKVQHASGLANGARSVALESPESPAGSANWRGLWGRWSKPKGESIPLPLSQTPAGETEESSQLEGPSEAPAGLLLDEF